MLGFSLTKILFTALVVLAVWYAYGWVRRLGGPRGRRGVNAAGPPSRPAAVQDMVRCAVCGEFTAASGPSDCPRDGCPYRA